METTKIKIISGMIQMDRDIAYIEARGETVVAINVPLISRNVQIWSVGSDNDFPILVLAADIYTTHTNDVDNPTEVLFEDFKGWSVFAADTSRYTVYVCLVKDKESNIVSDDANLPLIQNEQLMELQEIYE